MQNGNIFQFFNVGSQNEMQILNRNSNLSNKSNEGKTKENKIKKKVG